MENKKHPGPHLRLVKTPETDTSAAEKPAEPKKFRSTFAQNMNNFADDIDKLIDTILAS